MVTAFLNSPTPASPAPCAPLHLPCFQLSAAEGAIDVTSLPQALKMRSSMAMQSARSMGHAAPFRSASTGPRAVCRVQATISAEKTNLRAASNALAIKGAAVAVAAAAAALLSLAPPAALAIGPIAEDAQRCTVSNLDKFAETRSKFSQEASGGMWHWRSLCFVVGTAVGRNSLCRNTYCYSQPACCCCMLKLDG